MRVWVDLTNSPHVLVLRPIVEALRRAGPRGRRSPRATSRRPSACCERFGIEHDGRSAATAAAGWRPRRVGLASPLDGAARAGPRPRRFDLALGHGSNDVTVAARAAADPLLDDVRLRVGDGPAHGQLPPGADGRRARRDPARAPVRATARRARSRAYAGLKEEYYLADFEPDPAVLRRARPRPAAADRGRAHAARGLALPPLRERPLRRRARSPARAAQTVVLPRTPEQRAELRGGGFIVPERAIDAQSLIAYADLVVSAGRHDEPRGRRARHPGLDDLRGPPRRRRRARSSPTDACARSSARTTSCWRSAHPAPRTASASAATRRCWRSCSPARRAARWLIPRPLTALTAESTIERG